MLKYRFSVYNVVASGEGCMFIRNHIDKLHTGLKCQPNLQVSSKCNVIILCSNCNVVELMLVVLLFRPVIWLRYKKTRPPTAVDLPGNPAITVRFLRVCTFNIKEIVHFTVKNSY